MRKVTAQLADELDREPTDEEIAYTMSMSVNKVATSNQSVFDLVTGCAGRRGQRHQLRRIGRRRKPGNPGRKPPGEILER